MIQKVKVKVKSLSRVLTLCNLVDCGPLGSSDHGILQARILEWVAISFSKNDTDTYIKNSSVYIDLFS